jgi:hypothetical protein
LDRIKYITGEHILPYRMKNGAEESIQDEEWYSIIYSLG